MSGGLAGTLADFSHAGPGKGAAAARLVMRLSLFDWCAVAMAGRNEAVARILRETAMAEGGSAQAGIIGAPGLYPAAAAAMVNGATSHALDYDDTHFAHIGHTSVAVIPAALALAQARHCSGAEFLDAALVGAEASVRIGRWLGRGHYQGGFHQTATAGAFGATIAAARLMRLGRGESANALAIAASRAAGLKAQFGTMAKPYHAGMAAETGVRAAMLARRGFVANPAALDGPQGFGASHMGRADMDAFSGLGRVWLMEGVSHKFHACCHGTHAMIEALATLMPRVDGAEVAALSIAVHERWLNVCNIAVPETGLEVKFSYAHLAAMVLSGIDTAALDSFSDALARNDGLRRLAARARVAAAADISETAARVTVRLQNGKTLEASHELSRPVPPDERRRRIRHKGALLLGETKAKALWQALSGASGPDLAVVFAEIFTPEA